MEASISQDCQQISQYVDAVRSKVQKNLYNPETGKGCLKGQIDEYVQAFDFAKLMQQFAKDREYWGLHGAEAVTKAFEQLKAVVEERLTPPMPIVLKDLNNFGVVYQSQMSHFRWPAEADL